MGGVNAVAQVFAIIAGVLHVVFFLLESVLFRRPFVQRAFLVRPESADAVRRWAFNMGFYNLFLAAGAIAGVILLHTGDETAGRTLVLFTTAAMFLAAIVLFVSDPRRSRLRSVALQGLPPLIVLLLTAV
jgi:putative membrane protein